MSWRNYLDHKKISNIGRIDVGAGADSNVKLISSMLENAIASYQNLHVVKVCENKQHSFLLTEAGEEPLTEEEINSTTGEEIESSKAMVNDMALSLVEARRSAFASKVTEIAEKQAASLEMLNLIKQQIETDTIQYPIEILVQSCVLDECMVDRVRQAIYESTKLGDEPVADGFTLDSLQGTIDDLVHSARAIEITSGSELLSVVLRLESVLKEIPDICETVESTMDNTIHHYMMSVLPAINEGDDLSAQQIRISEILTTTLTLLTTDLICELVERIGNVGILVMSATHPVIGAAPILQSNQTDECDDCDEPVAMNETGEGGIMVLGLLLSALFGAFAGAGKRSAYNVKIDESTLLDALKEAVRLYNNRIDLIKKELPKIMKAYSPLWDNIEDMMEVIRRNGDLDGNTFILGKFDLGMFIQLLGNVSLNDINGLIRQIAINLTIPVKLKNIPFNVYVRTKVISANGGEVDMDDFLERVKFGVYGDDVANSSNFVKDVIIYQLETDSGVLHDVTFGTSPNLSDRVKKMALQQHKLAGNQAPINLSESVMIEAVYDNARIKRVQKIKNLFKYGRYSLRVKKSVKESEIQEELTYAAQALAKFTARSATEFNPKMERIEENLFNLGWIDLSDIEDPNDITVSVKRHLYSIERRSEILSYVIDVVVDTESTIMDIYASYPPGLPVVSDDAPLKESAEVNEDEIFDNPLDDIDLDDDDSIEDFEMDSLDDEDDEEEEEEFINPLD